MAGGLTEVGTTYSPGVGLIYIFNLIVGTGALTMPKAFSKAGWLVSLVLVLILAFMSFLTATFMIECMACANALDRWKMRQRIRKKEDKMVTAIVGSEDEASESNYSASMVDASSAEDTKPLISNGINASLMRFLRLIHLDSVITSRKSRSKDSSQVLEIHVDGSVKISHNQENIDNSAEQSIDKRDYYDITERMEMGKMASMFFNKHGVLGFYICLVVYLYGDLAIYAAAVPKSLRDVVCTFNPNMHNNGTNSTKQRLNESQPCWPNDDGGLTRFQGYQVFLAVFVVCMTPFTVFNAQKTKYLQLVTTLLRWISFIMMITIASMRLYKGTHASPPMGDIDGVPNLFGVCIYSFMCHHSLPSLVAPIKNKGKLNVLLASDYILILGFYALLSFTGSFAFKELADLYTLNFSPNNPLSVEAPIWIKYFLALFPVFTISANFPIIAITLRNNLKTLFHREGVPYSWMVEHVGFPLLTLIPPILGVFFTDDVEFLVGITGSYAGAGIQYVIPAFLVFQARKDLHLALGTLVKNKYKSPFGQKFWVWLVIGWCVTCLIFVTYNHIKTAS